MLDIICNPNLILNMPNVVLLLLNTCWVVGQLAEPKLPAQQALQSLVKATLSRPHCQATLLRPHCQGHTEAVCSDSLAVARVHLHSGEVEHDKG